jgi:peptidoglycan/xylan/chitin deacetylase (PgdA/CDA1 family)
LLKKKLLPMTVLAMSVRAGNFTMKKKLLKFADSLNLFPLFNKFTRNRAAVFMMHHFCAWGERDGNSLPVDILDKCLQYISDNGYSVISLSEYVNKLIHRIGLHKTVVFTVDDGYEDFYEFAYPIFKKHHASAAIFLISDFVDGKMHMWWDRIRYSVENARVGEIDLHIGTKKLRFPLRTVGEKEVAIYNIVETCKTVSENERRAAIAQISLLTNADLSDSMQGKRRSLSWDQITEMQNHNIEFFPHTKTHLILTRCDEKTVTCEIFVSKERIESQLGKTANIFCYPNGRYQDVDDGIIGALKKSGYRAAVSAEEGFDHALRTTDLFRLRRHPFPDDLIKFKQLISGLAVAKDLLRKCH